MVTYNKFPNDTVSYMRFSKSNINSVNYVPSVLKVILPKKNSRKLRDESSSGFLPGYGMHHAQKRFLTSYAEGIKNLDRKNYEKAVVHLEDALVADPESEAAQEHLIGALYAEMGRITKRIDVIRKRLTKLNTSLKDEEINKKPITTKILIKFPAPQGLVDSEGLPRHLKRS